MEISRVALPESQYLARIGEVAYTVSSMEWTILGDLHRLEDRLPEDLVLARLEPLMTSGIAAAVRKAARAADDGPIKDYLRGVQVSVRRSRGQKRRTPRPAGHTSRPRFKTQSFGDAEWSNHRRALLD